MVTGLETGNRLFGVAAGAPDPLHCDLAGAGPLADAASPQGSVSPALPPTTLRTRARPLAKGRPNPEGFFVGYREFEAYMEIMRCSSAGHAGVMARAIPVPPEGLGGTAYVDWVLAISGGGAL